MYKKLGDICIIKDGTHGSFKNTKSNDFKLLLSAKNIKNNNLYIGNDERKISLEDFSKITKNGFPRKDDILFTAVGTIGQTMIWKQNNAEAFQRSVAFIRVKDTSYLNSFIYFYLKSREAKKQIKALTKSGVQDGIYLGDLSQIKIKAPELAQQKAIAHVLSTQESVITEMEELIELYEKRLRYTSNELLSGRLRVKEVDGETVFYKNTEWKTEKVNGEDIDIPMDWEVEFIHKFIPLVKGASIPEKETNYKGEGLVYLKTTELWMESASKRVTSYVKGGYKPEQIKTNDDYVISFDGFNREIGKGTVGLVSCEGEGVVSTHFYKISKTSNVHFSINLLKSHFIQKEIVRNAQGSISLSATKHFKKIQAPTPSMDEMVLISKILEPHHFLIKEQKELLELEKKRFTWLLDNLLSGKYIIEDFDENLIVDDAPEDATQIAE